MAKKRHYTFSHILASHFVKISAWMIIQGQNDSTLFATSLLIFCENFSPWSLKARWVRSPAKINWAHVSKHSNLRSSYNTWRIDLKLSVIDTVMTPTKYISRIFHIRNLRSDQFCDFRIISPWEKFQLTSFASLLIQYTPKYVLVSHDWRF